MQKACLSSAVRIELCLNTIDREQCDIH